MRRRNLKEIKTLAHGLAAHLRHYILYLTVNVTQDIVRMDHCLIEDIARDLQMRLWLKRRMLWPGETLTPHELLEPERAAKLLNVEFQRYEELLEFGSGRQRSEIAGLIDRQANKIAVAMKFPPEAVRFTGAHEIGHWILHPGKVMHRDRPIKGIAPETVSRSREEREADYFAACFLVPRKLAVTAFEAAFQTRAPLSLNDTTAFWLSPNDPDSLLRSQLGSLDFALAVASARSYGGRPILPLASQFGVSATTMALRVKELGLIRE